MNREDDIMSKKMIERVCKNNNIEIETSESDGLFEIELAAPEGYCFDNDLRYLVEEHEQTNRKRAYEVMYNRLTDYLPLKLDGDYEKASYKFTDDKTGTRIIEVIEFEEGETLDGFIAEVSELLWGDSGAYGGPDGEVVCVREPFTVEESIDRLRKFSDEALAWSQLAAWCGAGDEPIDGEDTDEKMELRNFMNDIMKGVKQ